MKLLLTTILAALCAFSPSVSRADEGDEVRRATDIIDKLNRPGEYAIPQSVLQNAKGIAVIRLYKAGLGVSAQVGRGVVVARTSSGWSGPTFIGMGGPGLGAQIGAKFTDYVLVLNTREAVTAFANQSQLRLGGSLSVALGPVGGGFGTSHAPTAAVYTYSHSRGLFAGVSLDGTVLTQRPAAIERFYGSPVRPAQILAGAVPAPRAARPLIEALDKLQRGSGAGVAVR